MGLFEIVLAGMALVTALYGAASGTGPFLALFHPESMEQMRADSEQLDLDFQDMERSAVLDVFGAAVTVFFGLTILVLVLAGKFGGAH